MIIIPRLILRYLRLVYFANIILNWRSIITTCKHNCKIDHYDYLATTKN